MDERRFDCRRLAIATMVAAGLAVGLGALLLHQSSQTPRIGPTSAALSDGLSLLVGQCLGLAFGSLLGAVAVRRGLRFVSGVAVGVAAFLVGVTPYTLLTAPSDVSTGDTLGWLVIVSVPAGVLVLIGAGLGAVTRGSWATARRLSASRAERRPSRGR